MQDIVPYLSTSASIEMLPRIALAASAVRKLTLKSDEHPQQDTALSREPGADGGRRARRRRHDPVGATGAAGVARRRRGGGRRAAACSTSVLTNASAPKAARDAVATSTDSDGSPSLKCTTTSEERSQIKRKRQDNVKAVDEHLKKTAMAASKKRRAVPIKRLEGILSTELSENQKNFFDEHANEDEKKLRGTAKMSNGQIHSYMYFLQITQASQVKRRTCFVLGSRQFCGSNNDVKIFFDRQNGKYFDVTVTVRRSHHFAVTIAHGQRKIWVYDSNKSVTRTGRSMTYEVKGGNKENQEVMLPRDEKKVSS